MVWLTDISNREYVRLWAYADKSEKTVITFEPLKMNDAPDWNPQWEEWNCYHAPLMIPLSDFERLLHKYFDKIYPTRDAFDGTPEECFDVCFHNWIGEKDWRIIIGAIQADLNSFSGRQRNFKKRFLSAERALCATRITLHSREEPARRALPAGFEIFKITERKFYESFLDWLDEALNYTSIIVAEGNL